MLKIPINQSAPRNLLERKRLDVTLGKRLDLFQERVKHDLPNITVRQTHITAPLNVFSMSQKNCPYSNLSYGKIGTIAEAGCGPLALEYAFRLNDIKIDFKELLSEIVNKGYRAYIYDEQDKIIDGAGTEYALFDNIGKTLCHLSQILECLETGSSVCILVQNSLYHEDANRKGNHFVTLIGIDEKKNAIIMDGNLIIDANNPKQALTRKPFVNIALSMKSAWAWDKEKLESFLY